MKKEEFLKLLDSFHVVRASDDFLKCVCPIEYSDTFLEMMSELGVRAAGFSFVCHSTKKHPPCGSKSGITSVFIRGFYSILEEDTYKEFADNNEIINFLQKEWRKSEDFKPCLNPAFKLIIPEKWGF